MSFLKDTFVSELANGVRMYCLPRRSETVELQIHIATGSIHEGQFLGSGLSHFLEHMAFQGCKGYPGNAVADTVNSLGGDLNAYTSYDRTCYRMQLPVTAYRDGVKMLSAMVRYPELPEERFNLEKDVILRECDRGADNPDSLLHDCFMKQMFLNHPLRHPVIGYREMIAKVSREMAWEYHQKRYVPERCVVVAAGGIVPDEFFAIAAEHLGSWERGYLAGITLPDEPFPAADRRREFYYDDPLCRVMYGIRAPGFGAPELPALELLFGILGTGDGSILNRKLVLDNHLAHGLRSFCYSFGGNSIAGISAKTEPDKLSEFCNSLEQELSAVVDGKISEVEMEREKGQQYADRLRELRDFTNVAGEIAGGVIYAGTPDAGDVYLEHLEQTTVDDLRRVAAGFLQPGKWVKAIQKNRTEKAASVVFSGKRHLECGTLSNGVKTIFVPDHDLELCNFFMVLPGGALCEKSGFRGITKLVAQSLTSGSSGMPEKEILRKLDEAGVDLEISGGLNSMTLDFSAPRRSMDKAVGVLAEILHEPLFPDEAWQREIGRLQGVIKERQSSPVKYGFEKGLKMLYGDHPYGSSGYGSSESIGGITGAAGKKWFANMCFAPRTVWGFGGDCKCHDVEKWSEVLASALPWYPESPVPASEPEFPGEKKIIRDSLPREQTVAMRILPGIACSKDNFMSDVCDILYQSENGLGAKLFKSVREKHALSYAVGMSYIAGFHPGYLAFYAMTSPDAGQKVLELLDAEILRLGKKGWGKCEFDAARANAVFEVERMFDTPEALLRSAGMEAFYGFDPLKLLTRQERLKKLPMSKCNEALKTLMEKPAGVEVLITGSGK